MSRLGALVNPAGGLRYHVRALRYRRRLWPGFTQPLGAWLAAFTPRATALLLVGPSAGYCLPAAWLGRFATVDALEPDPLARWLLRRRFPTLRGRLHWHHASYLTPTADGLSPARLANLARDFPAHAIVFCNLLGQLAHLHPEAVAAPSFPAWKDQLGRILAAREWATFHDRLSGPLAPQLAGLSAAVPAPLTDEELMARFYVETPGQRVELQSHLTAGLFPAHERHYLAWQLVPGWFHLIEAIHS